MNTETAAGERTASPETRAFEAEVGKLLDLMINSLYSHKEIFLRELISNASDACDRLRYAAITQPELLGDDPALEVRISLDRKARTITVADNGIGMNHDDLVDNLGTIARSGTARFLDRMTGDATKDVSLIGRFGVGFYSAFMVADRVTVTTAKAGESEGWRWTSEGAGGYVVAPLAGRARGTAVELHLRRGEAEFLDAGRLKGIVKTYSDHIALPIRVVGEDGADEVVNQASALWMRPRKDITAQQYAEFYRHVAHAFDEPWLVIHNRAEGKIEYTNLLFVPKTAPFDLFHPDRRHGVKLYVKRVFITDDCEGLVPRWLRFLQGVVDSEDLPLNISREMLQHNPLLARIRRALVKRVLGELERKAGHAPEEYESFWTAFGAVLKEGLYEDEDSRERLLALVRARSTGGDGLVGLADYVARMKDGQGDIFTLTGEDIETVRGSPQLEGFRARGLEVLLLTDPIDEFWIGAVGEYQGKRFRSVTRGDIDLSKFKADGPAADAAKAAEPVAEGVGELIAAIKQALGARVRDVRVSDRLTDSAVCLVADEGALDMRLERLLRQHRQIDAVASKVLEINPRNALIKALAGRAKDMPSDAALAEAAELLLDQARIIEGEPLPDPAGFARRMTAALAKGYGA
ncbi:MAG TPA: molecular chaperone HtpG [Alphaproteobacteria bacterium]